MTQRTTRAALAALIAFLQRTRGEGAALAAPAAPWKRRHLGAARRRLFVLLADDPQKLGNLINLLRRFALWRWRLALAAKIRVHRHAGCGVDAIGLACLAQDRNPRLNATRPRRGSRARGPEARPLQQVLAQHAE